MSTERGELGDGWGRGSGKGGTERVKIGDMGGG